MNWNELEIRKKEQWKYAFISVMVIGLCAHVYKFTNYLPTADSLYNLYSKQNVSRSARPFCGIACAISSYFDLPVLEGILSLLYIVVTAIIVIELFEITDKTSIILIGGGLVAFPAITSTMAYMYTADGYMLAMALAALAVYVCIKKRWGVFGGAIILCFSMGIYQAYLSFALVLAFVYFIYMVIGKKYSNKELLIDGLKVAGTTIIGMVLYYLCYNLALRIQHAEITTYQGMNKVGISITRIKGATFASVQIVKDFLFVGGQGYRILHFMLLLVMAVCLVCIIISKKVYKNIFQTVYALACGAGIIPAICIWSYTSDDCTYHSLMLTSIVLLFVMGVVLYSKFTSLHFLRRVLGLLLAIVIYNYVVIANESYLLLDMIYERTYAKAMTMLTDINNLENSNNIEKIIVVGNRYERSDEWFEKTLPNLMGIVDVDYFGDEAHISRFFDIYMGKHWELVSPEDRKKVIEKKEIQNMPVWPKEDSICVYDNNIVVIKLSEGE